MKAVIIQRDESEFVRNLEFFSEGYIQVACGHASGDRS